MSVTKTSSKQLEVEVGENEMDSVESEEMMSYRSGSKESYETVETFISGTFSTRGSIVESSKKVAHESDVTIFTYANEISENEMGSYKLNLDDSIISEMKTRESTLLNITMEGVGANKKSYCEDTFSKPNKLSQNVRLPSDTTFGTEDIAYMEDNISEIPRAAHPDTTVFEKQVIVAVLSETFKRLKLLQRCLPFPAFSWKNVTQTSEEYLNKIMSQIPERIFPDYYEFENDRLWKMQVNLYEIVNIIFNTTKELYHHDSYTMLVNFLEEIRYMRYQENVVFQENVFLRKLTTAFKKKLNRKELLYGKIETEETVFSTKEEMIFDTKLLMQTEKRYIESWERERRNQNTMKIELEENALIDKLRDLAYSQRSDNRILNEIETFLLLEIGDIESQVKEWSTLYTNELEERDVELTQMFAEKESIDNRLKSMLIMYNEREEKVQEIRDFFAERAKEEEIKFYRNKGATIIQRWWRRYQKIKRNFLYQQKMLKKQLKEAKAAAAAAAKAKKKK